jgi:hypothetical protein
MPRLRTTPDYPERLASAPRSPRLPISRALTRVGQNALAKPSGQTLLVTGFLQQQCAVLRCRRRVAKHRLRRVY